MPLKKIGPNWRNTRPRKKNYNSRSGCSKDNRAGYYIKIDHLIFHCFQLYGCPNSLDAPKGVAKYLG